MRLINVTDLPTNLEEMFRIAVETLTEAGYIWVGLDHFAVRTDSLALAHQEKTLVRTFNGFKPGPTKYMIGLGPTSTSALRRHYAQAHYDLNKYYEAVNKGEFPILRGIQLEDGDISPRRHIFDLLCNQETDITIGGWQEVINELRKYPDLVEIRRGSSVQTIQVTEKGRYYLRNICKLFDERDVAPEHNKIAQLTITRKKIENPAYQSA
jgi:oxygen-independent coproporphyrinogen-3 oxidase